MLTHKNGEIVWNCRVMQFQLSSCGRAKKEDLAPPEWEAYELGNSSK